MKFLSRQYCFGSRNVASSHLFLYNLWFVSCACEFCVKCHHYACFVLLYVVGVHKLCFYHLGIADSVEAFNWGEGKTRYIPDLNFT